MATSDQTSTSAGQSSTSTPEYMTLRKCYKAVINLVKEQPGAFCDALFAAGYIPPPVRDFTRNRSILDEEKAQKLVDTVIDRIEHNPSVYHGFVKTIEGDGPWTKDTLEQLQECYEATVIDIQDKECSSDESFHSLPEVDDTLSLLSSTKDTQNKTGGRDPSLDPIGQTTGTGSSQSENIPLDSAFCLQKCSPEQFLSEQGCPEATGKTLFPYLHTPALSTNDRMVLEATLVSATNELRFQFADTDTLIAETLKADVLLVKNFALDLVADLEQKENEAELRKADSIPSIILALQPYKSFLNYDVIESIVAKFGSPENKEAMQKYIDAFDSFCKRSAFEVPTSTFPDLVKARNQRVLSVKLTSKGYASLKDMISAQHKIASILAVKKWALRLCSIEEGCVCLRFLIPVQVADKVFPLSQAQTDDLSAAHIRVLGDPRDQGVGDMHSRCVKENVQADMDSTTLLQHEPPSSLHRQVQPHDPPPPVGHSSSLRSQDTPPSQVTSSFDKVSIQEETLFPFLDMSALDGEDKIDLEAQLTSDANEMITRFADFTLIIKQSMEAQAVSLERVIDSVLSLEAFTEDIGVTLLDIKDKERIQAASCLSDVFITLRGYISFFNYHIIEHLIKHHGSPDDHKKLEEYLNSLSTFCQRNVFEVPPKVFSTKPRRSGKVFALKCTERVTTLENVQGINKRVAEIFGLQPSALQLCSIAIHEECIELYFLISTAVAERVFPVSSSRQLALNEIGLRVLVGEEMALEKSRELIRACRGGLVSQASSLIEQGANVDYLDYEERMTPLLAACEEGHTETCQLFIDKGADMNKCNQGEESPLLAACQGGHTGTAQLLVDKGADVSKVTPLLAACDRGHTETAQFLIAKGADVKKCNIDDRSPLLAACEGGHTETAVLLINKGADVSKSDFMGWSPILAACEGGLTEIASLLIDKGADVNELDDEERSLLLATCEEGHTETAQLLIEKGASVNRCDIEGRLPLLAACEGGHTETAQLLIDKGADVNRCDDQGRSPLLLACEGDHTETALLLVNKGAADTSKECLSLLSTAEQRLLGKSMEKKEMDKGIYAQIAAHASNFGQTISSTSVHSEATSGYISTWSQYRSKPSDSTSSQGFAAHALTKDSITSDEKLTDRTVVYNSATQPSKDEAVSNFLTNIREHGEKEVSKSLTKGKDTSPDGERIRISPTTHVFQQIPLKRVVWPVVCKELTKAIYEHRENEIFQCPDTISIEIPYGSDSPSQLTLSIGLYPYGLAKDKGRYAILWVGIDHEVPRRAPKSNEDPQVQVTVQVSDPSIREELEVCSKDIGIFERESYIYGLVSHDDLVEFNRDTLEFKINAIPSSVFGDNNTPLLYTQDSGTA